MLSGEGSFSKDLWRCITYKCRFFLSEKGRGKVVMGICVKERQKITTVSKDGSCGPCDQEMDRNILIVPVSSCSG